MRFHGIAIPLRLQRVKLFENVILRDDMPGAAQEQMEQRKLLAAEITRCIPERRNASHGVERQITG